MRCFPLFVVACALGTGGCALYDDYTIHRFGIDHNTERQLSIQYESFDHLPPKRLRVRMLKWGYNTGYPPLPVKGGTPPASWSSVPVTLPLSPNSTAAAIDPSSALRPVPGSESELMMSPEPTPLRGVPGESGLGETGVGEPTVEELLPPPPGIGPETWDDTAVDPTTQPTAQWSKSPAAQWSTQSRGPVQRVSYQSLAEELARQSMRTARTPQTGGRGTPAAPARSAGPTSTERSWMFR